MLFNSLNTLLSLVREDQDKAQEYIQELSRVLRYTLQGNDSKSVFLKDEIEFVSAYIFLLKMRFEDNLSFDICIIMITTIIIACPLLYLFSSFGK